MDLFQRLLSQGNSFFAFGDTFAHAFEAAKPDADASEILNGALEIIKQSFEPEKMRDAANTVGGLWTFPLESWQRTANLLGDSAIKPLPNASLSDALGVFQQPLERVLSTPGLGYNRESQEQLQQYAKLKLHYQKASQAYSAAFADMGKRSIERLQDHIKQRTTKGESLITSARQLYDLWIDSSEEVYGEFVIGEEFVQLHGKLTNTLMALKQHEGRMLDDYLEFLNLPSRGEIDTLHRRFRDSRRETKTLQAQLNAVVERFKALQKALRRMEKQNKSEKAKKSRKNAGRKAKPKSGRKSHS